MKNREVSYDGDESSLALPLVLEEPKPGLPVKGVAGSAHALDIAEETVRAWLEDPGQALKEPAQWPDPILKFYRWDG